MAQGEAETRRGESFVLLALPFPEVDSLLLLIREGYFFRAVEKQFDRGCVAGHGIPIRGDGKAESSFSRRFGTVFEFVEILEQGLTVSVREGFGSKGLDRKQ